MKKNFIYLCLTLSVLSLFGCMDKESSNETETNEVNKINEVNEIQKDIKEIVREELPVLKDNSNYMIVDSPEGLKVRNGSDLSAKRIAGLKDKMVVKILSTGPKVTIDDIESNWYEVELPQEVAEKENVKSGWVFGGYLKKSSVDIIDSKFFYPIIESQDGLAAVGSYVMPKKNECFEMYKVASQKSKKVSTFNEGEIGIVIRAYADATENGQKWYYILNQSKGIKGWIFNSDSLFSTAEGYIISENEKQYLRKNADVLVEEVPYKRNGSYVSSLVLCSDNIHYITRVHDANDLIIYDSTKNNSKEVSLSSQMDTSNNRESNAMFYSAKSNVVYFGWNSSIYSYSVKDDKIEKVFDVDLDAPEALCHTITIQEISVSKDERYFFLEAEFETSRRYISRMIAYDSKTKVQKIIDSVTPNCDSDHYYEYSNVQFDENNNAVYTINFSDWRSSTHVVENALITISSDSENWPQPVMHMLPAEQYSERNIYLPGTEQILCCGSRFCVYDPGDLKTASQAKLKTSYRFTENSIYESINSYRNYQFNEDKSIVAILDGRVYNTYISFYSTKTFNLLYAMKLNVGKFDYVHFWWNGKMLVISDEKNEDYIYSTYNITIKEKENQISDNEALSKEQVALCCETFRNDSEAGEYGYKFIFSPNGLYLFTCFDAWSENDYTIGGVIGAYEVTGNNKVHMYPSFANIKLQDPYPDYSFVNKFDLGSESGIDLEIEKRSSQYNKFGNIRIMKTENKRFLGETVDWDISAEAYGVQFEDAAKYYWVDEK